MENEWQDKKIWYKDKSAWRYYFNGFKKNGDEEEYCKTFTCKIGLVFIEDRWRKSTTDQLAP